MKLDLQYCAHSANLFPWNERQKNCHSPLINSLLGRIALTNILKPLTDKSRHKLQSTDNFIDAIKTVQIPDDHKFVSFDVKSLSTIIPLQLALDCTKSVINKSHYQPQLPTEDLMNLLHLCLTSTYFQYNGKHYKQLHGTALGSPVSVVVTEIVMQNIEDQALATYSQTVPLWLRYVDDTITNTAVHEKKNRRVPRTLQRTEY